MKNIVPNVRIIAMLFCVLIPAQFAGAQTTDPDGSVAPQKLQTLIIQPRKDQVPATERIVGSYNKLQDALAENHQAAVDDENIEKAKLIAAEMKRLNDRLSNFAEMMKTNNEDHDPSNDKPLPNLSEGVNHDAYKDKEGNIDSETVGQLLELAAAGVCIYAPPYCPLAMAVAKLLGLSGEKITNVSTVMDGVNRLSRGEALNDELLGKFDDLAGVAPGTLKVLKDWNPKDPVAVEKVLGELNKKANELRIKGAEALGPRGPALVTALLQGDDPIDAFKNAGISGFDSLVQKQKTIAYLGKIVYQGKVSAYIDYAKSLPPK